MCVYTFGRVAFRCLDHVQDIDTVQTFVAAQVHGRGQLVVECVTLTGKMLRHANASSACYSLTSHHMQKVIQKTFSPLAPKSLVLDANA